MDTLDAVGDIGDIGEANEQTGIADAVDINTNANVDVDVDVDMEDNHSASEADQSQYANDDKDPAEPINNVPKSALGAKNKMSGRNNITAECVAITKRKKPVTEGDEYSYRPPYTQSPKK